MRLINIAECPSGVPVKVVTGNKTFKGLSGRTFSNLDELADSLKAIDHYVDTVIMGHVLGGLRPPFDPSGLSIIGTRETGYLLGQRVGENQYISVAGLELGNP